MRPSAGTLSKHIKRQGNENGDIEGVSMKEYIAYCGLDCESCGGCGQMDTCEKLGAITRNNPETASRR